MHPDAPYLSILLCLMPDDFIRQVESAATQWVNRKMCALLCRLIYHNMMVLYCTMVLT
jgi:hypothetical protein